MPNDNPCVLIIGCSSGIGRALSRLPKKLLARLLARKFGLR